MDKEIERQIDEISSSAMGFRNSIDGIIYERLKAFFKAKGRDMSRDSKLKDLFGGKSAHGDWYELEDIGLRIPDLKRHKAFNYVTTAYVLIVVVTWTVILLSNLEMVFIVWGLPVGMVASVSFMLTLSPVIGIMAIFPKHVLPVDNIDKLVDGIIAENWTDLLAEDKRLFKEILQQELTADKEPVHNNVHGQI